MNSRAAISLLSTISALLLFSCELTKDDLAPVKVAVDSLQRHYAPDGRIAVFSILWERHGGELVVKGEVDNPKAKGDALAAIGAASGRSIVDSITILPDPKLGDMQYGIVAVSVGNVRSKPGHPNELCTQAMMGMVVKLLKLKGGWYYIQLPDNYLGWLEDDAMQITTATGVNAWKSALKVITTAHFALVRQAPNASALPVCDVVAGALLKNVGASGHWVRVALPDGRTGYIEASHIQDYDQWKRTGRLTAENIEKTAKMLTGVPYLWGGTSPKGMDCSGYAKTVFRLNGLELNRDADQQALMGEEVMVGDDFGGLRKGDLLFFGRKATNERPERITHVGIYLEKREFIHAPGGAWVRTNSFDPAVPNYSESLCKSFVRARRVISTRQVTKFSTN